MAIETDLGTAEAASAPTGAEGGEASSEVAAAGGTEGSTATETAEQTASRVAEDDSAKTAKATEKPAPKAKLKIRDREWDEDELQARLDAADKADETFRGSSEQFKKATQLHEQASAVLKSLTTDPIGTLRYLRSTGQLTQEIEDLAEQVLTKATEEATLTPEQKERKKLDDELARYRQGEQKTKQDAEQNRLQDAQAAHEKQIDDDLAEVFEKSTLPKTLFQMRRIGTFMLAAHENGVPYSKALVQHAANESFKGFQSEVDALTTKLSGEQLVQLFPALVKKLRAAAVAQVVGQKLPTLPGGGRAPPAPKPAAGKPVTSFREFRDSFLTPSPEDEG